jgi:undecaprenyl pyrophosphate phosphatase UppP
MSKSWEHVARISFLIAISALAGAATIKLWDLQNTTITLDWFTLGIATITAALSAYFCIVTLLNVVKKWDIYHLLSTGLSWAAYCSGCFTRDSLLREALCKRRANTPRVEN